ncbi:MAG TPA: anthranilate phosphoribosyltransferase [Pirellulales bacterium]|jgi:anthranilate phosphoribosyltransferase|nr:anthranilate phosphoribosyltransferase [Pirellulales bacterium]
MIEAWIRRVEARQDLGQDEMSVAIDQIMRGNWPDEQIAALLLALARKGECVDELVGAALAMRGHMSAIPTSRTAVIDTCGTGGDASRTFNISTAAALVTAAAGVPVAKHGNRRMTSRTGSADVLAELGVNIEAGLACVADCLDELGICFCFAPLAHGSMQRVAQVRRELGVRTIFNMLGPLTNPVGAQFQLLGIAQPHWQSLLAEALRRLGTRRALVVHGDDGLDEVTLAAATTVYEATPEGVRRFTWRPADFGFDNQQLDSLEVDGPQASAALIRRVLAGEAGAARDIVVANAAAALWTAGRAQSPRACAALAETAIDSRHAAELLARLAERSYR